ncbi:MAG TPA: hypothetical protein VJQ57_13855 [Acidimicrobiia bacterium]|nr:hypothetical protein [Acidimicrobiia bacterium]
MTVKVGDELILVPTGRYRAQRRVKVSRVGRKFFYVIPDDSPGNNELRERFLIATKREDSQHGTSVTLYTREELDIRNRRQELFRQLMLLGVEFSYSKSLREKVTIDQLEKILEVVS